MWIVAKTRSRRGRGGLLDEVRDERRGVDGVELVVEDRGEEERELGFEVRVGFELRDVRVDEMGVVVVDGDNDAREVVAPILAGFTLGSE